MIKATVFPHVRAGEKEMNSAQIELAGSLQDITDDAETLIRGIYKALHDNDHVSAAKFKLDVTVAALTGKMWDFDCIAESKTENLMKSGKR